ncbi:pentatricopeptide repeat-containing protein At3g09040, mitochondrial-like [Selaginella moellendorffii]|uniref:pentatricopeptide repeat-containing protein At3g09040, mitochondrial-like n=1 Tax=Selaginella moellendorffii TaxID=88036 RepID=UPI000D1CA394|nr:pentatricopeptide repeat-containing protein At3g09040, mitochondrial-like [Selaginella moellendorffii]|eukprot:XP_024535548.1 pentatricopeptide repeat-containing protein At3g09040, mitochondrial-like [Selaginella moellendorffii]
MRGKNAGALVRSPRQRERITALLASLRACAQSRDLKSGQRIHKQAAENGDDADAFVGSALVGMYSKCGSMELARAAFDGMKHRDVVSWTSLISGYAENGHGEAALQVFGEMMVAPARCEPDRPTFLAALKACSNLATKEEQGQLKVHGKFVRMKCLNECMSLHSQAAKLGLDRSDVFVGSNLLDLYAKCGSLEDSRRVFDRMKAHSVVAWTSLVLGYCENGQPEIALDLFSYMGGLEPDAPTFVAALNACTSLASKEQGRAVDGMVVKPKALETGRALHARAAKNGSELHRVVAGALVDLYAKCGSLEDAIDVFERTPNRSVVSLTALMLGLVENGQPEVALKIFSRTQSQKSFVLDTRAFVAALKACGSMAAKEEGRRIDGKLVKVDALERGSVLHSQAANRSWDSDLFLASTLVDMYAKCGSLTCAQRVFDGMVRHDVVSWTALLLGYAENGGEELALELFTSMKAKRYTPDARTFVAVLTACSGLAEKEAGTKTQDGSVVKVEALGKGLELESEAEELGCFDGGDVFLASTLIALYAKCGSLENARRVFDKIRRHDVVSWTALMLGYIDKDDPGSAFSIFTRMKDEGFEPDCRSYVAALKACITLAAKEDGKGGKTEALKRGNDLHSQAAQRGLDLDKFVASKIVEMYSRCGSMGDARKFFNAIPSPSYEVRTELTLGYFENNEDELGVEMFQRLMRTQSYHCAHDSRLFLAALKSCGRSASLETLRRVHSEILRAGATDDDDDAVSNSMIDVYGKCSSARDAQLVFDSAGKPGSIGWTSLISGYSRVGDIARVLELFRGMQDEGVRPDDVALTCVLSAFSHAGLVGRGRKLLAEMEARYGIKPAMEHYVCVVDLLGRANQLEEALAMVEGLPGEASALVWRTLLGACHKWKNARVGRVAFEALVKIDRDDAAAYVLMTNMLRWQEDTKTRAP